MQKVKMLKLSDSLLLLIDFQEKLIPVIHDNGFISNSRKMLEASHILEMPVIHTEQIPEKLGPTIAEFQELLSKPAVSKVSFSACTPELLEELAKFKCKQILIAGIEAHVCVLQTVLELIEANYEVHILCDCVSSRLESNCNIAIERMKLAGAIPSSAEMAIFELQKTASGDNFRKLLKVIK